MVVGPAEVVEGAAVVLVEAWGAAVVLVAAVVEVVDELLLEPQAATSTAASATVAKQAPVVRPVRRVDRPWSHQSG